MAGALPTELLDTLKCLRWDSNPRPTAWIKIAELILKTWLRIWDSNPASHWLTVKSVHLARILRNKIKVEPLTYHD